MLPREKLERVKKAKRKGYIPYPFFMAALWFSDLYVLNVVIITIAVLYIFIHQGYYFYITEQIKEPKVGF